MERLLFSMLAMALQWIPPRYNARLQLMVARIRILRSRIDTSRVVPTSKEKAKPLRLGELLGHGVARVMHVLQPETYRRRVRQFRQGIPFEPSGRPRTPAATANLVLRPGEIAFWPSRSSLASLRFVAIVTLVALTYSAAGQTEGLTIQGPERSINGFSSYKVNSPYQSRPTWVEVLTPDKMDASTRYPVLYLLPVNDGLTGAWGNGLVEAKRNDIANRFNVICVSPEYDYTPWYGDHPSDRTLAQESYLLKAVVPAIEAHLPVLKAPQGRILLGFSKSGFGALTIALRNPDIIGKALAWDAPLTMKTYFPGEEEMIRVFQTEENFARYCIPELIVKRSVALQNGLPRIFLLSNANPADSISDLHTLLEEKGIPHRYAVDEKREHTWTSGWLPVAVNLLFTKDASADVAAK